MQNHPYTITFSSFASLTPPPVNGITWGPCMPNTEIVGLHYHNAVEYGYCQSGAGIILIDGEALPFQAPCATLLHPGQLHMAKSTGGIPSVWVFITFSPQTLLAQANAAALAALLPQELPPPSACLLHDEHTVGLMRTLCDELEKGEDGWLSCAKALVWSLMVRQRRLFPTCESLSRQSALHRIGPVIDYITRHYAESLTVESLAAAFHLSSSTLRRWFYEAMGISPLTYCHRVRLSAACSLLRHTDTSILDISLETGYHTQSSFNRQFLREYGCTPMAYRRKEGF